MTTARTLLDAYARQPQHGYAGHERDYSAPKAFAALRAVLDLHKAQQAARIIRCEEHEDWMLQPDADCPGDCPNCEAVPFELCTCDREYPCPTVQAITTALESK